MQSMVCPIRSVRTFTLATLLAPLQDPDELGRIMNCIESFNLRFSCLKSASLTVVVL
ncbi:hypothetical protein Mapa_007977 [Marchantia paleacea]|nr:hypothetical protein Mapa_007977 [Marchantia paleacea]